MFCPNCKNETFTHSFEKDTAKTVCEACGMLMFYAKLNILTSPVFCPLNKEIQFIGHKLFFVDKTQQEGD
jgi:hypothetical protein